MKKNLSIVLALLAILGLGTFIVKKEKESVAPLPPSTIGTSSTRSTTIADKSMDNPKITEALEKLQKSVASVVPHFIDYSATELGQVLSEQDQKIKDAIVGLRDVLELADQNDYNANIILRGVGTRYILITQPSGGGSYDEVLDSQTGKSTFIIGGRVYYLTSEERKIALYIDDQVIRTYTLDQPEAVIVSGSQLFGTEVYHSGEADMPSTIPKETHTKNSITISVFDSAQRIQNPSAQPTAVQTMHKKVRDLTLSF